MFAIRHEISTSKLMKSKIVDINIQDNDMNTALILAIQGNHSFTVQLLLEDPDININAKDKVRSRVVSITSFGIIWLLLLFVNRMAKPH